MPGQRLSRITSWLILDTLPDMSHLSLSIPSLQSVERVGLGEISGESQAQRYVPFSYFFWPVNEQDSWSTDHVLFRSTS